MRGPGAGAVGLLLAGAALGLGGCDLLGALSKSPGFSRDKMEAALDPAVGGPDTCLILEDVKTGRGLYQYGFPSVCNRPLTPCGTFQIPLALIGLSDGTVKPGETWARKDKVQPYKAWEHDTDLAGAWSSSAAWFFRDLALAVGPERFRHQLSAFGYGQGAPLGRPDAFWMGPAAGGGLFISTRNQADILRKLALGTLPVKPEAVAEVERLMADETRGQTRLSDLGASCHSIADASRDVSWWVGRIQGPKRDIVFALSIESADPLPGVEIRHRMLPILTRFGFLPQG